MGRCLLRVSSNLFDMSTAFRASFRSLDDDAQARFNHDVISTLYDVISCCVSRCILINTQPLDSIAKHGGSSVTFVITDVLSILDVVAANLNVTSRTRCDVITAKLDVECVRIDVTRWTLMAVATVRVNVPEVLRALRHAHTGPLPAAQKAVEELFLGLGQKWVALGSLTTATIQPNRFDKYMECTNIYHSLA
jgi:hypothetical protein